MSCWPGEERKIPIVNEWVEGNWIAAVGNSRRKGRFGEML